MILMGPNTDGVAVSRQVGTEQYIVSSNIGTEATVAMLREVAALIEQGDYRTAVEATYVPPEHRDGPSDRLFNAVLRGLSVLIVVSAVLNAIFGMIAGLRGDWPVAIFDGVLAPLSLWSGWCLWQPIRRDRAG